MACINTDQAGSLI